MIAFTLSSVFFARPETWLGFALGAVLIGGPYNPAGPGGTPSRARIFVCQPPAGGKDDDPCARTILSSLARRAFRRPVADADIKPLFAFYRNGRKEGGFERGIQMALRAKDGGAGLRFLLQVHPGFAAVHAITLPRSGGHAVHIRRIAR